MRDSEPHTRSTLSRRAWLGGALALGCSRATEATTGASAEPHNVPPVRSQSLRNGRERGAIAAAAVAVVELFTSQGCSSCPPADRALREITAQADPAVLTLSFHVDYWNYLGWSDPYSSPRFSARQRRYAGRLSGGRVFTPQAIVNGRRSALGSAQSEIEALIRREKQLASSARVELEFRDGELSYRASATRTDLRVTLLVLQNAVHNSVPRGENQGEELSHVHVVRELIEAKLALQGGAEATGAWKPDLARLTPKGADLGNLGAAALVSDATGAIVGAAQIELG